MPARIRLADPYHGTLDRETLDDTRAILPAKVGSHYFLAASVAIVIAASAASHAAAVMLAADKVIL